MDVGKLPNHVNIVLCVWLFSLACVFSICFVSYKLEFWLNSLHGLDAWSYFYEIWWVGSSGYRWGYLLDMWWCSFRAEVVPPWGDLWFWDGGRVKCCAMRWFVVLSWCLRSPNVVLWGDLWLCHGVLGFQILCGLILHFEFLVDFHWWSPMELDLYIFI